MYASTPTPKSSDLRSVVESCRPIKRTKVAGGGQLAEEMMDGGGGGGSGRARLCACSRGLVLIPAPEFIFGVLFSFLFLNWQSRH